MPTAGELTEGIARALKARDMPAVVALLKWLAVIDPVQAQLVYDTIKLGMR
jgi:hypothetical protein